MIVVKKYPNRRLYDTHRSVYVNLEDLAELIRSGHDVKVVDAKTDEDLTKEILLQIVLDVLRGVDLIPAGMLRRLIGASGTGPTHLMLRQQLSTGLDLVSTQLDRMEALMQPPRPVSPPPPAPKAPPPEEEAPKDRGDEADPELVELRERLAALEKRLSRR
ncbi:MAG: polyhydroxyalkanoate synthesis regulator DNA-binding domain-containing protein [Myxococcales bacterium]|nr:polyhydroxyalkanoate synthesis regulator DNA-binding domain-containing protein [Myxococcales bacterium]